jgi:uncharacterized protein YciI
VNTNNNITDEFILKSIEKGKQYVLMLYKEGPHRNQSPEDANKLQMEHLHYLFSLRAQGMLLLNGPVTDQSALKGIGIFNSTEIKDVEKLVAEDPAVKAGRLVFELYPLFGIPGDSLV